MAEGQSFPERLWALRHSGFEALAPLWIEQLPPEEALPELRHREGTVFRLQEARFLLDLDHHREALEILRKLEDPPPGLVPIRAELSARAEVAALRGLTEIRPSEHLMRPLPVRAAGHEPVARAKIEIPLELVLVAWLESVQGWRRVLGV